MTRVVHGLLEGRILRQVLRSLVRVVSLIHLRLPGREAATALVAILAGWDVPVWALVRHYEWFSVSVFDMASSGVLRYIRVSMLERRQSRVMAEME